MTAVRFPGLHPVESGSPYQGYVYGYPHKTAYRPLDPPRSLGDVWATEPRSALFLYVHVPFCTMRCGFCNLFTTANPNNDLVALYLDALRRQAVVLRDILPDAAFARFAIGGGTPTYLNESDLDTLFDIAEQVMDVGGVPIGVEVSPDTATPTKVRHLLARGVSRISIGVQSFVESEAANSGRPQSRAEVDAALSLLAESRVPTRNIDLIYGLPGQTPDTWLYSVREALTYRPHELFLYPLYVRPLTGLGRSRKAWDDVRLACYREARAMLLGEGYSQVSMRLFRHTDAFDDGGPAYCCQSDGMVGLGCGARSYTRSLHYSLDYAVGPKSVKAIIGDYLARDEVSFTRADHGFDLVDDEPQRRFLLQSILHTDGLNLAAYTDRFGTDVFADFPDLVAFEELGLLRRAERRLTPTPTGLERTDALGPWFFSEPVRRRMTEYEAK